MNKQTQFDNFVNQFYIQEWFLIFLIFYGIFFDELNYHLDGLTRICTSLLDANVNIGEDFVSLLRKHELLMM